MSRRLPKRTSEQAALNAMKKLEAAKLAAKRKADDAAFVLQIPAHPW